MNGYPSKKNINPNSPTHRWAKELLNDELKGQKKISIKISTHEAIQELSSQRNGATYDDIILAALGALKREQEIGPETDPLESIANDNETEEE
jgi:hypothetical protein